MGSEKADLQSEKVDMRFRRAWGWEGANKQEGKPGPLGPLSKG